MDIEQSVQQLLKQKQVVIERFYDIFLNRHPEVRPYFENVNLNHQATLLTMALIMVESHYSQSYPATTHYLHVLGHRHHQNGIKPEHFAKFRDCLLETLAEFHGDDWTTDLAHQWRQAVEKSVSTMLEGYERAYTY